MKKTRLLAALLCCALLSGCGAATVPDPRPEPSLRLGDIAYVPLDDRPDNAERVEYLANSLGYRLVMPELADYRTALDGQPKNYDSLQCGNPWSLYTWVLDQEAAGCDRYILSMDQLLSGGLVSSRSMAGDEIPIPGGGTTSATELMDSLLSALAQDENNVVWLLDSVMRLAPTVGYQGGTLEDYNALRAYGAAGRPELPGEDLDALDIRALYHLDSGGEPLEPADFGLTEEQVASYLAARSRKLTLSERMLHTVQCIGYEHFRVLIGIDDSSEADSIQKNEIAYLRSQLRDEDALLSGVDDLAFKAVTKLYLDETGWEGADVSVAYFGGTEDRPACAYDYQPLDAIVAEHLEYFGLQSCDDPAAADVQLVVLTQPEDEGRSREYYEALIARLKDNAAGGVPTILMDASNNRYGTAFHDALVKAYDLGLLLSYSGFLDMAIVTGTALSHGVARYAWLCQGNDPGDLANTAFRESLAESIVLDFCYRNTVRNDISAYVRELGGDPNNFYAPPIDTEAVRQKLESAMAKSAKPVLKNLSQSNFITDLTAYRTGDGGVLGWGSMTMENWSFPWQRVFEVRPEISAGAPTRPNYSIFERISQVFS